MPEHKVILLANEGIFRGLAKQNMLFHQCLAELIDNAIAAQNPETKFRIDVILSPVDGQDDLVDLYVADNGMGMNVSHLGNALQLGESATVSSRLNEHGFGLKNALATLSGGNGTWKLWTRTEFVGPTISSEGPFKAEMTIEDDDVFPTEDFLPTDAATVIKVRTRLSFVRTVQGRGAPTNNLAALRQWLIEHLGVLYRGYLEQDSNTFDHSGVIVVAIGKDRQQVPPVQVPLGNKETKYFEVEIAGKVENLRLEVGSLDEVRRDVLVRGDSARFYYQGNIPTQGIDIRLGKRTIATRQIETIWKTENGRSQLSRHNNYNDFLGELFIPELPRGILSTTNNKADFNLDDAEWSKIFEILNTDYRPVEIVREKTEAGLREKWTNMLKATNTTDAVTNDHGVWPTSTKIDVYRKAPDGRVTIYELKVGSAAPLHLYQLKMYWDGLVLGGEEPQEAILLAEDFSTTMEEMANQMNTLEPPTSGGKPYNFMIERHRDKGL